VHSLIAIVSVSAKLYVGYRIQSSLVPQILLVFFDQLSNGSEG